MPTPTSPDPGFGPGDLVQFCQGDDERTMLLGRVVRAPWGSRKQNVSIRTTATGSMYIRLVANVELIEKAGGDDHYEISYRKTQ